MATYYVSAQNGNDTNDGLSAANAWVTIGKAVGEVAAGDTVYIGAGIYREKPSLTTSGTDGNEIRWIPDPECQYLTTDNPGIVRVTGCGVDELPTAGHIWDFQSYNELGEVTKRFNQIYIDGSSDGAGLRSSIVQSGSVIYGATVIGRFIYRISSTNYCISVGFQHGFDGGTHRNCIAIARDRGYNVCALTENCISVSGDTGWFGGDAVNSIAIAAARAGFRAGGDAINCLAISCGRGYEGSSAEDYSYSRAIACLTGFHGTSTTNIMNIATCSTVYCSDPYRTDAITTTENSYNAKHVTHNLHLIAEALKPLLQFDYNDGDNTVSIGDYDILGLARRLGDGTIDIGPYAHSIMDTNFTEASPALEFTRAGMQKFVFWAEGGTLFTKKVSVKWSAYAGANKPQIIVDGDHVTRATTTATGDGTAYEEISVSATPDADGEIELFLYARDTDAAAKTYFKDLE